ncbi:hypothetical protein Pelo_2107 [Pelomyxa schiedti]|nr:hypothetical protein Pelo_2107 [Pelomyxa schiedti]
MSTTTTSSSVTLTAPRKWFKAIWRTPLGPGGTISPQQVALVNCVSDELQLVTGLHVAALKGDVDWAHALLAAGANPNAKLGQPGSDRLTVTTATATATAIGSPVKSVSSLFSIILCIDPLQNLTPLHLATLQGNTGVVIVLLASPNVDIFIKNSKNQSAMDRTTLADIKTLFRQQRVLPNVGITLPQLDDAVRNEMAVLTAAQRYYPEGVSPTHVLSGKVESGVNRMAQIAGTTIEAAAVSIVITHASNAMNTLNAQRTTYQAEVQREQAQLVQSTQNKQQAEVAVKLREAELMQAQQNLQQASQVESANRQSLTTAQGILQAANNRIQLVTQTKQIYEQRYTRVTAVIATLLDKVRSRNLFRLTVDDVSALLRDVGLVHHVSRFQTARISGGSLLSLDRSTMTSLGVIQRYDQDLLLHSRKMIRQRGEIHAKPSSPACWSAQQVLSWMKGELEWSQGEIAVFQAKLPNVDGISLLYLEQGEINGLSTEAGGTLPQGSVLSLWSAIQQAEALVYDPTQYTS